MIKHQPIHINKWLVPFSWLYGFVIYIRNKLFDWKILKSVKYDIPVICVGNISVGGTGKTPHVEYLIRILQLNYRIAVLSRGYKRKTSGYLLADNNSTSNDIGDEPYQIKKKYPHILVAVDGNRRRGIKKLLQLEQPPQVIILDDAFQHRYVTPSYPIVLTNYNRPIYDDTLLPAGRLRESVDALHRANTIMVTKCPEDMEALDFRIISHDINPFPYQGLYYTKLKYNRIKFVFGNTHTDYPLDFLAGKSVLLISGIASPEMLVKEVSKYANKIELLSYPDHHDFKKKDVKDIIQKFNAIPYSDKIILTTEKDATRLVIRDDMEEVKDKIFYIPIEVAFFDDDSESEFKERVINHIEEKIKKLNS